MTEGKQKYKNNALIGTLIFHGLLLLGFIYFGLSTPLPLPEEEGVLVNLGYTESGAGQRQPLTSSPPPPQPQPAQSDQATEDIATQATEEAVALPDSEQDREEPREDTQQDTPQPAEESTQEEVEPEPEPQVDPRAMFPGRDRRTTESQNQGEGGTPGNQGRPDGTTDGTATEGGGQGDGVEFSLSGRSANNLPLPDYTTQSQGRVVVRIWVNRNGQVTRAEAGARGTTTSDQTLWREAEKAARKASFDSKSDAAHEQQGTITYNFIRLN